jgi:hypothetical protein
MITIRAEIPDSLYRSACELAEEDGIPLEQLAGFAIAQALGLDVRAQSHPRTNQTRDR